MKTLDLKQVGLQELSHEEMTIVDGGSILDLVIGILVEHLDDLAKGMQDGFKGK